MSLFLAYAAHLYLTRVTQELNGTGV